MNTYSEQTTTKQKCYSQFLKLEIFFFFFINKHHILCYYIEMVHNVKKKENKTTHINLWFFHQIFVYIKL